MANIKSAKKRILVAERNRQRNRSVRSGVKTAMKKAVATTGAEAEGAFREAVSRIDKAVTKGVLHKNTAARRKSQLARLVKSR